MMQFLELQTPRADPRERRRDARRGPRRTRPPRETPPPAPQARPPAGPPRPAAHAPAADRPPKTPTPTSGPRTSRPTKKRRLAQILQEARGTSARPRPSRRAQSLLGELLGATWSVPFPPRLVANLQSQFQEAIRQDARERLRVLAGRAPCRLRRDGLRKGPADAPGSGRPSCRGPDWRTIRLVRQTPPRPLVVRAAARQRSGPSGVGRTHLHQIEMALNREPANETELRQLLDRTSMHRRPLPTSVKSRLTGADHVIRNAAAAEAAPDRRRGGRRHGRSRRGGRGWWRPACRTMPSASRSSPGSSSTSTPES